MTDSRPLRKPRWGTYARFAPVILLLAIVGAYLNSLRAPFVYDDTLAIPANPTIRQLWPLGNVLLPQADGGLTVSGRPILNLSFALNYALSGTNPWSYHVFNFLVHASATLLLFGLVRRTANRLPLAFAVAALWGLHPLHTQAVTYTVQRAESLMGCFYLLTLYAFVRGVARVGQVSELSSTPQSGRVEDPPYAGGWLIVSVVACVLGMGTKEVMATAPLLVLLYDRTFVAGSFAAAWRTRRGYYGALAATWLVLGALVLSTGGNRGGTVGLGTGVPLWAYPHTQFEAVARYLALAAWPHPLVFEYGTRWVQRAGDVLPYLALVVPLLVATLVALRRWPVAGFLGAWFFLILAPTSLAPGTIQMIVEHRVYLPLAAVVVGGVLALEAVGGRRVLIGTSIAAVALAALTARRNHDYRSHLALWSDTVAKRPLNPRAHEGLAEALAELGRADEAVKHRAEALRLAPDDSTYHYNLGLTLAEAGRFNEAIRHYELSLRIAPNEARAHNNLAIALVRVGRSDDALLHYAEAARLKPDDPHYHYNVGVALQRAGRMAECITRYETALRLQPDHADAHFNLAAALVKLRRMDDALAHYRKAVQLRPDDAAFRIALANALVVAGRAGEAVTEFRGVLAQQPENVEALFGLGGALVTLRQPAEAAAALEKLLSREPDHADAHFKLGNALLDLDRVPEALTHFQATVRLRPRDAEAQHNLGVAYARLERWPDARRQFETALSLKPEYPEARRNLERLRTIMGF